MTGVLTGVGAERVGTRGSLGTPVTPVKGRQNIVAALPGCGGGGESHHPPGTPVTPVNPLRRLTGVCKPVGGRLLPMFCSPFRRQAPPSCPVTALTGVGLPPRRPRSSLRVFLLLPGPRPAFRFLRHWAIPPKFQHHLSRLTAFCAWFCAQLPQSCRGHAWATVVALSVVRSTQSAK